VSESFASSSANDYLFGPGILEEWGMREPGFGVIEEQLGVIIVDGQRREVWVRSEPDDSGTWHNALLFRRAGRRTGRDVRITGVEWHAPPGVALDRARELGEEERVALFRRALRPRPPVV
jgi:hypothetical protein